MKHIIIAAIFGLILSSCNAQNEKTELENNDHISAEVENPSFEPKGNWSVNKEYDENGNLVRLDSTYSYSYSTLNGDTLQIKNMDSIIASFRNYFDDRMSSPFGTEFMNPFWENDGMEEQFFEQDFFRNGWNKSMFNMDEQFKLMDSIRESFLKDFHPELYESRKQRDSVN